MKFNTKNVGLERINQQLEDLDSAYAEAHTKEEYDRVVRRETDLLNWRQAYADVEAELRPLSVGDKEEGVIPPKSPYSRPKSGNRFVANTKLPLTSKEDMDRTVGQVALDFDNRNYHFTSGDLMAPVELRLPLLAGDKENNRRNAQVSNAVQKLLTHHHIEVAPESHGKKHFRRYVVTPQGRTALTEPAHHGRLHQPA